MNISLNDIAASKGISRPLERNDEGQAIVIKYFLFGFLVKRAWSDIVEN